MQKALFTIGTIIVSFVAQKVFISNVIKQTYHVRKMTVDHGPDFKEGLISEVLRRNDMHEASTEKWYYRMKEYVKQRAFR